jgi:hypothetical protein
MGATYDTGISKRLGAMVFVLLALLIALHLAGFSVVAAASGSVKL